MGRILFITASRIGDAVLSTSLLAHLHERYPQAKVTVACGAAAAPLFTPCPFVERVIPMVKRRRAGHWRALWRQTAFTWWDLVVDLRGSALAWLVPAARRRVIKSRWAAEHRLAHLARLLDLDTPPLPRLWADAAQQQRAEQLIPSGGPVLALGPTANWGGKQWPAERFADLSRRLTAPDGPLPLARVAVFGGPDERAAAAAVLDAIPAERRIDLVGALSLPEAFACLSRCALYVGNDSGLMHMAAAAGIPTLGLFGPSSEVFYGPCGPRSASVRGPRSFEDICHAADFDYRSSASLMLDLDVETVVKAACDLYLPPLFAANH